MEYIIIQPSTSERNLGGICYSPYWHYALFKKNNIKVKLFEDISLRQFDKLNLDKNSQILIDLSSYPQIDACIIMENELRRKGFSVKFIGYDPLIVRYNFIFFDVMKEEGLDILEGVFNFIFYSRYYDYGLLNDCDTHIKSEDTRVVVPVFLGIGCKRGCDFCYVSHSKYPYGYADRPQIKKIIDFCYKNNFNIHFSDEDFFLNPELDYILSQLKGKNIKWIALASSISLSKAIKKYGEEYLLECGNFLNEIGLEVIDETIIKKRQDYVNLLNSKLNIFWLTMTFLPHDTINSQRKLGQFLMKYGWNLDDIDPRIANNSTLGGLGQFFQSYDGTPINSNLEKKGVICNSKPIRLFPSFINNEILNAKIKLLRELNKSDFKWFNLYYSKDTVLSMIAFLKKENSVLSIYKKFKEIGVMFVVQLARLQIIEEIE